MYDGGESFVFRNLITFIILFASFSRIFREQMFLLITKITCKQIQINSKNLYIVYDKDKTQNIFPHLSNFKKPHAVSSQYKI